MSPAAARSTSISCFKHVDALGYGGWIGCEYNPQRGTAEGLKWATLYL